MYLILNPQILLMRYPYFLSLLFALLCVAGAKGQHISFPALSSHGKIPIEFITPPEKRIQEILSIAQSKGQILTEAEAQFLNFSEHIFSNYVNSGYVAFGDSISQYCEHILDKLLAYSPEERSQFKVYLFRSVKPEIKCFYTGRILISSGLVARIDNEYQLTFLLAREIIRFRNAHSKENFISHFKNEQSNFNPDSLLFIYTSQQNKQADYKGYILTKIAGIELTKSDIDSSLYYLSDNSLCFGDYAFEIAPFQHGNYIFPTFHSKYINESNQWITSYNHTRFNQISKNSGITFENEKLDTNKRTQLPSERIKRLQTLARNEHILLLLAEGYYCPAIVCCQYLIQKEPGNILAVKTIGDALYALSLIYSEMNDEVIPEYFITKYSQRFEYLSVTLNSKKKKENKEKYTNGYETTALKFINNLYAGEITILAADWNWRHLNDSNDSKFDPKLFDLFRLLNSYYKTDINFFSSAQMTYYVAPSSLNPYKPQPTKSEKLSFDMSLKTQANSRLNTTSTGKPSSIPEVVDLISTLNKHAPSHTTYIEVELTDSSVNTYQYYKFAFERYTTDINFISTFRKAAQPYKKFPNITWEEIEKKSNTQKYSANGLGATNILVGGAGAEVMYFDIYNKRKKLPKYYISAEEKSFNLQKDLTAAQKAPVGTNFTKQQFIELYNLSPIDTVKYNAWCYTQNWKDEFIHNLSSGLPVKTLAYNSFDSTLTNYYKTNHIIFSGLEGYEMKREKIYKLSSYLYEINTGQLVLIYDEFYSVMGFNAMLNHIRFIYGKIKLPSIKPS